MGLFSTLDVSASGLAAQRRRVEVLAQNIANSETTRTPEGGPIGAGGLYSSPSASLLLRSGLFWQSLFRP